MTPAEQKFSRMEASLMRARDLGRVLMHVTECGHDLVDPPLWGGVYILASEMETALNAASELWTEARAEVPRP